MGDATAERLRRGGYTRESARFTSRDGVILELFDQTLWPGSTTGVNIS